MPPERHGGGMEARPLVLIVETRPAHEIVRRLKAVLRSTCDTVGWADVASAEPRIPSAAVIVAEGEDRAAVEDVLRRLHESFADLPVLLSAHTRDPESMMDLLRLGVDDFVASPSDGVEVLPRIWRLLEARRSEARELGSLKEKLGLQRLIGESRAFVEAVRTIPLIARCDASVMLEGETGTGKDVFARAIHYLSRRSDQGFISINCGAIPVDLVENELFGHERAAFTGATASHEGLVRSAEKGTLFLDEIDALPAFGQVKLLHLLQHKEYRPLGSSCVRTADVRFIAATNADVEKALEEGSLRSDLYYRLNVISVKLPPLRERQDDSLLLARHFLARFGHEYQQPVPELAPEAAQAILLCDWPGNVRELEHVIERAIVMGGGRKVLHPRDLHLSQSPQSLSGFRAAKAQAVERFETTYIRRLLRIHAGNITHASQAAGKNRRAFWELIRKHGIDPERFRTGA